jgi:ribonuclease HII
MMAVKFDLSLLPAAPDFHFESELWAKGIKYVAGIDEAGRGALAGPVSAAAMVLPAEIELQELLEGVRDSKEMTPEQREFWSWRLKKFALSWGVGFASHQEIDTLGIVPATRLAVQRAVNELAPAPQHLLIDYLELPECPLPQTALVKGDSRSLSIAAASILAKTSRDALMRQMDICYPDYGFATHKGYATATHRRALLRLGPTPIHRRSFELHKTFDDPSV